ncbi:MAG: hypothetical protein KBD29_01310 [Candidatus Magasanikbacteria bacterium]|nr:hypothetical protein [Candidatus Magasanikbacteria bacterium]
MTDKIKIVITKRHGDFHASVEGKPDIWGGNPDSSDAAIGDLIRSHETFFNISVDWNKDDTWTQRYVSDDPHTRGKS